MDESPPPILISQYVVYHLFSSNMSCHNHLVTQPQSIITSSVVNHCIKMIPRFAFQIHPFRKITTLSGLKNQWKCLWCNIIFQGINAKKSIDHVIGAKYMHTKRYQASINKSHLPIYKYLNKHKDAKKGLINDYLHKMISSV